MCKYKLAFVSIYTCFLFVSFAAGYDYVPLHFTYTFELPSSEQCLEIEIINDPLAEDWEAFSVLLSTNSSAVNITTHTINIYIEPNDNGNNIMYEQIYSLIVYLLTMQIVDVLTAM